MRGENRQLATLEASVPGSSPHARGKHSPLRLCGTRYGLIPACAGKTRIRGRLTCWRRAHPRMRGENHGRNPDRNHHEGLIPACAGKTAWRNNLSRQHRAHPRMRGENHHRIGGGIRRVGSSPHARGKPIIGASGSNRVGLIPACAGKTKSWLQKLTAFTAHPRMRGEN